MKVYIGAREDPHIMLPDVIESFTSEGIILQAATGGRVEIKYKDLVKVSIETTDQGPWLPDCFWYLSTQKECMRIENDDPLIQALLHELQQLPGFKNELVIKAMSSTGCNDFIVWEKEI